MSGASHYPIACEKLVRPNYYALGFVRCGNSSTYRYEAMGGGWFHLCEAHGRPHAAYSEHVTRGPGEMLRGPLLPPVRKRHRDPRDYAWTPERRAAFSEQKKAWWAARRATTKAQP